MTSKEQAKIEISKLVKRFEEHSDEYKQSNYNETQTRRDFIDPFFRALGWDIDNQASVGEAYRDVIHEDRIEISGKLKSPDYSFRINGKRQFFVEAKKPSIDVKNDTNPAYQIRRYGWSAKLKISVVSDFEEFAIYDCSNRPNVSDRASLSRLDYFTYREYLEKFDFIWDAFSREAVLLGKSNFYNQSEAKKGTSSVDEEFLESLDNWRTILARDIFSLNKKITEPELNFVVQHTIDRIIFLRIAEDRNIEFYGTVKKCLESKNSYRALFKLFSLADEKYNSGLFDLRKDTLTSSIEISNGCLNEIIDNLYFPKCPYEFSVIPVEILGSAYEQFLSKAIQISAKGKIEIGQKPDVKKAGGVFYTPEYIVEYIIQRTLGQLIDGKSPKQIESIKILDPASGSGSFLLGAYDFLLRYHHAWYQKNSSSSRGRKNDPLNPDGSLTTEVKKKILLNNIFGVDIDANAVEVTKLSLLLKCLEGETQASIKSQQSLFHERVLPTLDDNIKCGNSLVDTDFYETETDAEVLRQTKPFNWQREFKDIFKVGGFDIIVGNPPYIRIQRMSYQTSDYFFAQYETPTSKMDLSLLFFERSFGLIREKGLIGFISTSQWLSADYGAKLRKFLSTGRLHEIMDFGSLPVFKDADTYPAVVVLSKNLSKDLKVKSVETKDQLNYSSILNLPVKEIPLSSLTEKPWSLGGIDINSLGVKLNPLSEYGKAYIGTKSGMNEAFVLTKEDAKKLKIEKKITLPYAYRGGEVVAYKNMAPGSVIIYPYTEGSDGSPILIEESILEEKFPNAYKFLLSHKKDLQLRQDSRKYYAKGKSWFRHLRAGSYKTTNRNKLAVKGISLRCDVGILTSGSTFDGARCPCIVIDPDSEYSEEYFLGILNSKLAGYYLKSVCPAKLNNYIEFTAKALTGFPIRVVDLQNKKERSIYEDITQCAKQLITLKESVDPDANRVQHFESRVDKLVYELYGLSEEQIDQIEGAFNGER